MGPMLYEQFLEECVEDVHVALVHYGINGLMTEFERWLEREGRLKED